MKKLKIILVYSIVCILALSGCSLGPIDGFNNYLTSKGRNSDKSLRIESGWTKTGIGTHFHAGPNAGPAVMYSLEGCMQYIRTTDEFYFLLAESFEHTDEHYSILTIRENAKWHDGNPVVAIDILAYYALTVTDLTKYAMNMEVIDENGNGLEDDKKLKIYWKEWKEPTTYSKNMLLALDTKNGSIQYKFFKNFIDRSLNLIYNGIDGATPTKEITKDSDGQGETKLGRHINSVSSALSQEYNSFRAEVVPGTYPSSFMATGPYKIKEVSANQMLLVKNDDYYLDTVQFEQILATQYSNENQKITDLKAGRLDYIDGVQHKSINRPILRKNKNLVSYKYYDQGAVGLYYNLEKSIWSNDKVRLAFQYMFNRDAIKNTVKPYAVTSYKPMMIMSPVEARQYMSPDAYEMIDDYSFDVAMSEALLYEAGWTKQRGKWYDENGKQVTLTIGFQNLPEFLKIAQILQAEMGKLGIGVTIKSGNDWATWFSVASSKDSIYDAVIAFTELNTYGSHPGGSMKHFFDTLQAHVMHLPTDPITQKFVVNVDILNPNDKTQSTGKANAYTIYQSLFTYEGTELENYVDSIVLGFSKYNYGVQFFENITGSYFDASRIGGLPGVELMSQSRDIELIPEYYEPEFKQFAMLNSHFTQAVPYVYGMLYPKN